MCDRKGRRRTLGHSTEVGRGMTVDVAIADASDGEIE